MLRLAFDFIITWRETRTRPNAYLFKDITYNGDHAELSHIVGYDEERMVKNIRFENLKINGKVISDDMTGKPAWYKTSDMARFFVGEHVGDIVFVK